MTNSIRQQGDVRLFDTENEGDILIENGIAIMDGGLETSVYLSLFGGNENDSGLADDANNWWGNVGVTDPNLQYRSETQFALLGVPSIPANLNLIQQAIERDLQWMFDLNIISNLEVTVSLVAPKRINIVIDIQAFGDASQFEFTENWEASL